MKIILIDNNDSFTFNIVDILRKIKFIDFHVEPYEKVSASQLENYDKVIISPGPDRPEKYLKFNGIIETCINKNIPLLGICLGHQAICQYFGAKLFQLQEVVHGRQKDMIVTANSLLFSGIPSVVKVGLYHSWAIDLHTLPKCLLATGVSKSENCLMAVAHKQYKIYGIQFHPESFLTEHGQQMIVNFAKI